MLIQIDYYNFFIYFLFFDISVILFNITIHYITGNTTYLH